ncbi:MAG: thiamine pyrophosphate-binding protein [Xanthomonadales bacterium]|nr:thiamine pyrophosphate-binding protein [Xanthomonadales bacterium]
MTVTGGELITRILGGQGVGTVFAVAGASHTRLLDPLDRSGVTIVSNRHESGAVGSADGYARVTGGLGVALIIADQGLPNAVGGLAVAWQACSPVLVLVASPPGPFAEADRAVDQDQLNLVSSISKWSRTVPSVERLEDYLQTAIKHARSGRPGPVVLLLPENLLGESTEFVGDVERQVPSAPVPSPASVDRLADMISGSQRPMIITGAGAAWGNAGSSLQVLARNFGIPILANSLGRGQAPEDDERIFPWPYAQIAAPRADLVVVVGARLTQRLGLGLPPRFSAQTRFVQIDIEPSAFHRNRPVDLAIHADAGVTLAALVGALKRRGTEPFDTGWLADALRVRRKRIAQLQQSEEAEIHPLRLGAEVMARMPRDAVYVGDGADIQNWMYGAIRIRRPRGFLDHYPMGAMGSGTALAVGAAAALKEEAGAAEVPPVVLVTGDGSMGFHPAELHAASRARLRLIVIVGNDGAWGTELHGQRQAIGRDINTDLGVLPYEKLAEVFGGSGTAVEDSTALVPALDQAFKNDGVTVVNVHIDPTAGKLLKTDEDVRMILFSDILEGQRDLLPLTPDI